MKKSAVRLLTLTSALTFLFLFSCKPKPDLGLSVFFPDDQRIEYYRTIDDGPLKLGSYNSKLWPKDKTIFYIKWYDGDADIQTKVLKDLNDAFTPYTGKYFVSTTDPKQADFIISFVQNNQSWSYIGTDNKYIAATGQPTCNLGWAIRYRNNEGLERSGTAIHEIVGHALGYIHTLQSPACVGTLQWNKEYVYAKYAQIGWSRAQVDAQVFATYSAKDVTDESCDFKSNMCYPVSAGEANVVVGRNNTLSALDIKKLVSDYGGGIIPPPPPPVADSTKIISIGKPSSQSSDYNNIYYPSSKANDGIIADNNFNHTNAEHSPWYQIDLQSPAKISMIITRARAGCCNGRMNNLKTYVDGVMVKERKGYLQPSQIDTVILNNLPGRIIKLQCTGVGENTNIIHFSEVSVYSAGPPVVQCVYRDTIYRVLRDSMGKTKVCYPQ